jgi:hypothetical protein
MLHFYIRKNQIECKTVFLPSIGFCIIMVQISPKHCIEAGIIVALLFLLTGLFSGEVVFYKVAALALLLDISAPKSFWPFAFFWFNLSVWLGFITSRILLSVIFVVIIVPVAIFRKLGGKDRLMLKEFKKSASTVFTERNIKFSSNHLNNTY